MGAASKHPSSSVRNIKEDETERSLMQRRLVQNIKNQKKMHFIGI